MHTLRKAATCVAAFFVDGRLPERKQEMPCFISLPAMAIPLLGYGLKSPHRIINHPVIIPNFAMYSSDTDENCGECQPICPTMNSANHYIKPMGHGTLKRRAKEHALPQGEAGLQITNLYARLIDGGWPTPKDNYLFSDCSFTVANRSKLPFPASDEASEWVTLDFYIATTNNRTQGLSGLLHIGDVQWLVNLGSGEHNQYTFEPNDLYNMSRRVTRNLKCMAQGLPYYLYAQVRNDNDSQQLTGSFTDQTFIQISHIAEQGRSVAGRAVATFVAALFFVSKLLIAGPAITK